MRLGQLLVCIPAFVGCGGKVIFDGGTGGAHSSSTVTSSPSSTNASSSVTVTASVSASSGSTQCQMLEAVLHKATYRATWCDPQTPAGQCSGSVVIDDECGCPAIVLNEAQPKPIMDAKAAYAAWTQAGCGPHTCGADCMPAKAGTCVGETTDPYQGTCNGFAPF